VPTGEMVVLRGGAGPRPLGKSTAFVVASDRLYVGTGDSAAVDVFGLTGKAMPRIALRIPTRIASRENYERAVDDIVAAIGGGMREVIRDRFLELPRPKSLPPYFDLLIDSTDLVWVVLTGPGDPDTRLRAVDATGQTRSEIRLPFAISVTDIGMDYILGIKSDSDGVEHVVMYRLKRR
jgi:hypothetical protein